MFKYSYVIRLTIFPYSYYIIEELLDNPSSTDKKNASAYYPNASYGILSGDGLKYVTPMDFIGGSVDNPYRVS